MGRYKTGTSNNVVIVALRKFLNTPWVTAGETSSGKEKTVYNIMGRLVWGFFCFKIWNIGIVPLTRKTEGKKKQSLKRLFYHFSTQSHPH